MPSAGDERLVRGPLVHDVRARGAVEESDGRERRDEVGGVAGPLRHLGDVDGVRADEIPVGVIGRDALPELKQGENARVPQRPSKTSGLRVRQEPAMKRDLVATAVCHDDRLLRHLAPRLDVGLQISGKHPDSPRRNADLRQGRRHELSGGPLADSENTSDIGNREDLRFSRAYRGTRHVEGLQSRGARNVLVLRLVDFNGDGPPSIGSPYVPTYDSGLDRAATLPCHEADLLRSAVASWIEPPTFNPGVPIVLEQRFAIMRPGKTSFVT